MREHKPLIWGELARELRDTPQLVAQQDGPLDIRAQVGWVYIGSLARGEGERAGERRFHRAAPAQRATAIVDSRQKPLIERVGDVHGPLEGASSPGSGEQLERGLAVAVFEVLA